MLLNTRVILCNKLKMIDRNHVTITDMEQKKFKVSVPGRREFQDAVEVRVGGSRR